MSTFAESVAGNIFGIVQYNKDNRAFEGGVGANITIDTICSIMLNESIGDELTRYAAFNSLMLSTYDMECLYISYSEMISQLKNISWNDETVAGTVCTLSFCLFCLSVCLSVCLTEGRAPSANVLVN